MHRRLITVVWPCTLCLHPATALQYFVFVCVCVGGGGCMVLLFYVHVKQLRSWTNGSLFFCVFFLRAGPDGNILKPKIEFFLLIQYATSLIMTYRGIRKVFQQPTQFSTSVQQVKCDEKSYILCHSGLLGAIWTV